MALPAALGVSRSFSGRRWQFRGCDPDGVRSLEREAGISPALAQLLFLRGVQAGQIADYLNPTLKQLLPEPLLLKDMDRAVERAGKAVRDGETIAVFGDYDVDGSCSAALLADFLTELGRPPLLHIPDRLREGYGPNLEALLELRRKGASLVITVDCGATARAPLAKSQEAGLDVIVLDHHAMEGEHAGAFPGIHVNPNQPGDRSELSYLCAAGVTFLFAVALNRNLRDWYPKVGVAEPDLRRSLDIVGLATVCDVVPLKGLNRAFVRAAETRLSALGRPGVRALATVARVEAPFSLYHCGFVFGPRINAGGRVGRSSLGLELLTARSDADAAPLAAQLDLHNRERQAIESAIIREAIAHAARQDNLPFILASGDDWHPGVVGIVAGRLKDRFHKPALVVGFADGIGRGSARSVPGIDIGAIVRAAYAAGILEAGGGHPMAAGFSLAAARQGDFRDWLTGQFAALGAPADCASDLWLDALVAASGATSALAGEIGRAGPFGAGNAEPILAASDVRLAFADVVGQGHIRTRLQGQDGAMLSAIAFRAAGTPLGEALLRARGERIHAAGHLRENRWNGRIEAQLEIRDAAAAA